MKGRRKPKIVFSPNDKIHAGAHELVWRLFGLKGALLTNTSLLEDFLDTTDFPGHTLRFYSQLSPDEQKHYESLTKQLNFNKDELQDVLVRYPPLTDEESRAIRQKVRETLTERIAQVYGVVIPEILDGETRVWKVAELLAQKQALALRKKTRRADRAD